MKPEILLLITLSVGLPLSCRLHLQGHSAYVEDVKINSESNGRLLEQGYLLLVSNEHQSLVKKIVKQ